ncbi:unnamed protein product [Effrenium voratum]|uniref:Uncharacterized protein n=1 Tax=Effrenium voratum TaxID=2562239 RepID=A0AA36NFR7_9DINO|nr:unnamed protein product [Effrenium voratum]
MLASVSMPFAKRHGLMGLLGPFGPLDFRPSGELAGIEARLDRISEQVEACLTELRDPPKLRRQLTRNSTRGDLCSVVPEEAPSSAVSLRKQMIPFNQATPLVCWNRGDTEDDVVSLDGGTSQDASARPLPRRTGKPARSLDLRVASQFRQVSAQVLSVESMPQEERPMIRLIRRHRCDSVWELLEDPNSSRVAWWTSQVLKVLVILSFLTTNLQLTQDRRQF